MEQEQTAAEVKEEPKKEKPKKEKKPRKEQSRFWRGVETVAAAPIFLHDMIQDAFDRAIITIVRSFVTEYHNARKRYMASSGEIFKAVFALIVVICGLLLVFDHYTVYEYSYNGRVLGYVRSEDTVVDLLDVASEGLSVNSDVSFAFTANDNVTFRRVALANHDLDTSDQVLNKLTYMKDIEVSATAIYYDGHMVALVENETVAQLLITNVLTTYGTPDTNMNVVEVGYKRPVTTGQVDVLLPSLASRRQAHELLTQGGKFTIRHIVKADETLESLAEAYDVPVTEIYEGGHTVPAESVSAGEVVTINKEVEPVVVRMEENGTTTEVMHFVRETRDTEDLYIGQTEIEQKGEDGLRRVTGTIVKENGTIVQRDISKSEIVKAPVTEIVLNGTSDRPKTAPTGKFAMPLHDSYTVTSPYGQRWGRLHAGVDMACPTGTLIYASDGGVVIRASWNGTYGNCIEIEHNDGTYTRYAHLSGYIVSEGEEVYQGQEIGYVGSTGFSTGPHLHFEIHPYGGDSIDPSSVLPIYGDEDDY